MSSDNSYVIRASDATNVSIVNQNGDTSISEHLDVGQDQAQTSIKTYVNHIGKTGYVEIEAMIHCLQFLGEMMQVSKTLYELMSS